MPVLIQLFLLTFVVFQSVYSQKCNDCISIYNCPKAMDLLQKREKQYEELLRNAFCGLEKSDGKASPRVCCSMLSIAENFETSEDQPVENHRNLELLPEDCGHVMGHRLLGGTQGNLYEFPWMALIAHETRDGAQFNCAGSIINKRYVLTAAHCVKHKKIFGVRVGDYDISTDVDCLGSVCENHIQDIRVEESVAHENFQRSPFIINDIALIRLAEEIDFSHRNVHRICLPITSELRSQDVSNKIAVLVGWNLAITRASFLQMTTASIITAQTCDDLYYRSSNPQQLNYTSKQMCARAESMHVCINDGGSPLMLEEPNNNTNKYVQYGISSYGPQHCEFNYRAIYTDVTKYMKWILDHIRP